MKKPKYIIYDNFQEEYFLEYMMGYTTDIKNAHRYSEDKILEVFKEKDQQWLIDCRIKQIYGD